MDAKRDHSECGSSDNEDGGAAKVAKKSLTRREVFESYGIVTACERATGTLKALPPLTVESYSKFATAIEALSSDFKLIFDNWGSAVEDWEDAIDEIADCDDGIYTKMEDADSALSDPECSVKLLFEILGGLDKLLKDILSFLSA